MLYFADNQHVINSLLFYQDFKDTFVCNTQLIVCACWAVSCCFIKISKILLYAIHNTALADGMECEVVLSGFQRYFWMQYTTWYSGHSLLRLLFYQDFKDTFVCNTQLAAVLACQRSGCFIRISMNNSAAKVQKTYEICKFIWKYLHIKKQYLCTN